MTTNTVDCAATKSRSEATPEEIEQLFHPRSIALVGVSNNPINQLREMFLRPLLDLGFEGPIYPVHPSGGEVLGLKIFPSLSDIPGPVDFVMAGIPARLGPELMRDCGKKGVKGVQFFTSGFSEIGTDEGKEMEIALAEAAREAGVRVIGPNCMGIYCPETKIGFWSEFPAEHGPVGYLCQSGGNSIHLIKLGAPRGVRFSKVISYGNACDLNECDFLEYLSCDPKTEIIAAYVEGVRDGQRFVRLLREAARRKPVVLLKGGISEGGARAAASHTGSLAGSHTTWEALCKQLGVIQVHSIDELTDMIVTLLYMQVPRGRNVAIISGAGGGASVLATDDCERYGLKVPTLPRDVMDAILKFTPHPGNSVRNPIDSNLAMYDPRLFAETAKIATGWDGIDLVMFPLRANTFYLKAMGKRMQYLTIAESIMGAAKASLKPVAIIVEPDISPELTVESFSTLEQYVSAGFATYPSVARAARAISKLMAYESVKARSS